MTIILINSITSFLEDNFHFSKKKRIKMFKNILFIKKNTLRILEIIKFLIKLSCKVSFEFQSTRAMKSNLHICFKSDDNNNFSFSLCICLLRS